MIEVIGIIAGMLILFSTMCPTLSFKGSMWLRSINIIGSAVFVVYGILLPAIATAVTNAGIIIINVVHICLLIKNRNKG